MRLKLGLIFLCFSLSGCSKAQDRDSFYKAIDYCGCRVALAYGRTFTKDPEASSFKKIQAVLNNCQPGHSIAYVKLDELLKDNQFSNFSKKSSAVFDRLKNLKIDNLSKDEIIKKILDGIYNSEEFKGLFSPYPQIVSLRKSLENDLSGYLKDVPQSTQKSQTNSNKKDHSQTDTLSKTIDNLKAQIEELNKSIENLKQNPVNNDSGLSPLNWITILIAAALLIAIILVLGGKIRDLDDRCSRHRQEIDVLTVKLKNREEQPNTSYQGSLESKKFETYISDQNDSIQKLQKELNELREIQGHAIAAPSKSTPYQSDRPTQAKSSPSSEIKSSLSSETLYASMPNADGSFKISAVEGVLNHSTSFYKFIITDAKAQEANFEFLNEERAVQDATSAPESILNPVCKIKNASIQSVRGIITVKPGKVRKEGDKWMMIEMAEVQYE